MKKRINRMISMAMGALLLVQATVPGVYASDNSTTNTNAEVIAWEQYGQIIYNTTNGLMSNNVSSIAQTADGIVWMGTDEGLSGFDGNEFIEYGGFYHFDGVNDMVATKDGGVWYATTTYGGAIYLGSRFQHFDDVSKGVSNYALTITEAEDGAIYVGTLRGMVRIAPNEGFVVTEYTDDKYFYVNSMAAGSDNTICATTGNGAVFILKDGEEIARFDDFVKYQGKTSYIDGYFLVGCSNGSIMVFDENNPSKGVIDTFMVPYMDGKRINNFYMDNDERLWVLFEDAIGYYVVKDKSVEDLISGKCEFIQCYFDDFETGYTDMMRDYQGNYWITSSKRGALLLRKSMFTDEFSQLNLNIDCVNATVVKDNDMYVATNSGLTIINRNTKEINNVSAFANKAAKDVLIIDNNLYVCVYSEGLYKCPVDGNDEPELILSASGANKIAYDELEMFVFCNDGAYVVNEDADVKINYVESITNKRINCALRGSFGRHNTNRLYLGSDGAGIFIFENDEYVDVYDENDNLPSKKINDMVAYDDGFFAATGLGVAFFDGRRFVDLTRLPKELADKNCEQLFIKEGYLFAICNDSVFAIELDDLFNGDELVKPVYDIYDAQSGFFGLVSEGAKGMMTADGRMYLPCNDKVYSFMGIHKKADVLSYKLLLQSVKADERMQIVTKTANNEYTVNLTKDVEEIDILCSILNFSCDDPYVSYILHGVDDKATKVRSSELSHIIYEDLKGGSYTFWFDLLDDKDEMAQRIVLTINKEESIFEKLWVRMILLFAGFSILMYFVFKDKKIQG